MHGVTEKINAEGKFESVKTLEPWNQPPEPGIDVNNTRASQEVGNFPTLTDVNAPTVNLNDRKQSASTNIRDESFQTAA